MNRWLAALFLCLAVVPAARAEEPEELANDIARAVMSPYCPGVTLHECPSQEAVELRAQITTWARAGWERDRIIGELEAEFGPGIRALPEPQGTGLVAWLLPLAIAIAAAAVGIVLTRRFARGPRPEPQTVPATPAERKRLEAELKSFREGHA
jgi:cytochrome c-type biogenesis protein CcmH/NrfF